jgi:hypothetical protein
MKERKSLKKRQILPIQTRRRGVNELRPKLFKEKWESVLSMQ